MALRMARGKLARSPLKQARQQATSANGNAGLAAHRRAAPLTTPAACCPPTHPASASSSTSGTSPRMRRAHKRCPILSHSASGLSAVAVLIAFAAVPADDQADFASHSGAPSFSPSFALEASAETAGWSRFSIACKPSSYTTIWMVGVVVGVGCTNGGGGIGGITGPRALPPSLCLAAAAVGRTKDCICEPDVAKVFDSFKFPIHGVQKARFELRLLKRLSRD
ncbi:hypothetical protein C8J57DRAFT_1256979 [Mycena rebaudengoi]|nr:hypothetical protein C8J57DRAFT_1256979 [Mycena rebaudengoi]